MNWKHWRGPFFLALTLAVLSSIVFWNEFNRKPKLEKAEELQKKILPLEGEQVLKLTLHKAGDSEAIVFECQSLTHNLCKIKDQSEWTVSSPLKAQADKANVNSLLSALANIDSVEKIDLTTDAPEKKEELLTDYGISSDQIDKNSVNFYTIELKNGKKYTLYLGVVHPIGGNIFARIKESESLNENTVHLISPAISKNLDQKLNHWRDKSLFSFKLSDITSFELKGKSNKLITAQLTNDLWTLSDSNKKIMTADSEEIESFLNSVVYLSAKDFINENKKSNETKRLLNGTTDLVSLKLFLKNNESITLTLKQKKSGKDIKIYGIASHLDPIFELDISTQNRFSKEVDDFRMKKLISNVEQFTAQKITFSGGNFKENPLKFEKNIKDSTWKPSEKISQVLDATKISSFLEVLSSKKITRFHTKAPTQNELKNAIDVLILGPEDKTLGHFSFWKTDKKAFAFNHLNKKQESLELDAALLTKLPWSKEFFEKISKDKK